jgi:hypothetical protein
MLTLVHELQKSSFKKKRLNWISFHHRDGEKMGRQTFAIGNFEVLFAHYVVESAVMLDMSTNKAVFFLSSLPGRQYKGVEPY